MQLQSQTQHAVLRNAETENVLHQENEFSQAYEPTVSTICMYTLQMMESKRHDMRAVLYSSAQDIYMEMSWHAMSGHYDPI